MQYIKSFFFYLLLLTGSIAICISLLSLIDGVSIWWIKILDFPRQQMFIISLLCLGLFLLLNRNWNFWSLFFSMGLLTSVGLQAYYIFPYTSFAEKQVKTAASDQIDKKATVSIMLANVYMKNRNVQSFIDIAIHADPDMILVMETDRWWDKALQSLQEQYPYSLEYPLDNTYGMILYSKYLLIDPEIKFLQHEDVPSFHTTVRLPNGQLFNFHGMHPVPPKVSKYPDNIGEKEEELLEAGNMITRHQMPAIVAGDFNDVAWSHTSRLFQVENQLNDTRVGRGTYNSFNAQSYIMRWPLDHFYVTDEFEVVRMERLEKFGSDHFPMYVKLVLTNEK